MTSYRKRRRAWDVTWANGRMERLALTGADVVALLGSGRAREVERAGEHRWPSYRALAAAALFRASYHRWSAGKGYAPTGNDGVSGVPWSRARGGWGPTWRGGEGGFPAPTEGEARDLGVRLSKLEARFWLERAAYYREMAEREFEAWPRGNGEPANGLRGAA
jgi:hypothetical protein